jgi:HAD superfamily hydrolase (TIGR01509 family)
MLENEVRAVLWDMDGVLVDSAAYHYEAWRLAMQREGRPLSEADFKRTFGQRNDTVLRDMLDPHISDADIQRIADFKEAAYRDLVREKGIAPLPGVLHWLEALRVAGWRQAVASAAPRANVDCIVEAMNIAHYFDALTSAEDVTRGKPDPQVYLVAAARVGATPARAIVIEDAPAGVEGARRAGMKRIGVRSSHGALEADVVVDALTELSHDAFERLIEAKTF